MAVDKRARLHKAEGLKFSRASFKPTVHSLWVDSEFSTPIRKDHSFSTMLNPARVTAGVVSSLWRDFLNDTECFEFCPPALQSASDEIYIQVESVRPLGNAQCFTTNRGHSVYSAIALLCFFVSPYAVIFEIPKVIVYSLNRVTFRRLTHIREEVFKDSPFFTHRYSPATIVKPLFGIFVRTALDYSAPCVVRSGITSPMPCQPSRRSFSGKASATLGFAGNQALGWRSSRISARANAIPSLTGCWRHGREATIHSASSNLAPAFGIARVAAKSSALCRKFGARKLGATVGAGFCNNWHKPSKKILQAL